MVLELPTLGLCQHYLGVFPKVAHKIMSSDLEAAEAVDGLLEVRTSNNAKFFSCPAPGILPSCQ